MHTLSEEQACRSLQTVRPAIVAALAAVFLHGTAAAQGPACAVKARGTDIVVVVCASGTPAIRMRDAGVAACKSLKPCNAWIWEDEAKAPARAPKQESDLTKAEVQAARAVWMNDSESLVTLDKKK